MPEKQRKPEGVQLCIGNWRVRIGSYSALQYTFALKQLLS